MKGIAKKQKGNILLTTLLLLLLISIMLQGVTEFVMISYRLSSVAADTNHTYELVSSMARQLLAQINEDLQGVPQKINQDNPQRVELEWEDISYQTKGDLYEGTFVQEVSVKECLLFYREHLSEWEQETFEYSVTQKQGEKTLETLAEVKVVVEESFSKEKITKYKEDLLLNLLKQKDFATIELVATTRNIEADQVIATQKLLVPVRLCNLDKMYFTIDEEYKCQNAVAFQQYLSSLEVSRELEKYLEVNQLLQMQYEDKALFREAMQSLGLMNFRSEKQYLTSIGKECGIVVEKASSSIYRHAFVYFKIRSIYSVNGS